MFVETNVAIVEAKDCWPSMTGIGPDYILLRLAHISKY